MSFNFRSKPNIVFVLAVTGLAVMGWFSVRENRIQAESNRRVSETRDVLEKSASLRSHLSDVGAASRDYLREVDPRTLAALDTAVQLTQADFASLEQLTAGNSEQQGRLMILEPLLRSRLDFLKAPATTTRSNSRNTAIADATATQQAALSMQVTDQIHQFDAVEQQILTQRSLEAEANNAVAAQSGLVLSISVCLLAVLALVPFNIELARRGRAERAVTEQKKLLESILNSCKDAVVVSDRSGNIILRNPAALGHLPTPPVDAKPPDIPRLLGFYKPDGKTLYNFEELALPRALRGETVDALEICVQHPSRPEPQWLLETGSPLINDQGEQSGGVVFLRDITERRRVRVQLKAALQEAEAKARENKELTKLTDLLQSCQTIEEACGIAENALSTIFGAQPGGLFLTNSSRNLLEAGGIWNNCSTTEHVFAPDDCWALRLGKPYVNAKLAPPLRCSHLSETPASHCVCVPLTAQGETLGVLYVEDNTAQPGPGSGEQDRLEQHAIAVSERLSLALSNLKLREVLRNQSIRDPLTGLFNRRYLEESMVREAHRSARKGRSFSVVMMDLDHYKRFNDTFGHPTGDQLLREIGGLLKTRIRTGDLACRYGGEEFALILSEVGTSGAERCVDILRQEIKQLPANHPGQGLSSVTMSAGIAEYPLHGSTPEELIRAADAALYQAKREGRDRVVVSENRIPTVTT